MTATLKIGKSLYKINGSREKENENGVLQRITGLTGRRGAEKVLVETFGEDNFVHCVLIHFGRMPGNNSETICQSWIKR